MRRGGGGEGERDGHEELAYPLHYDSRTPTECCQFYIYKKKNLCKDTYLPVRDEIWIETVCAIGAVIFRYCFDLLRSAGLTCS